MHVLFVCATSSMVPYGPMVTLPCIEPSGWQLGLLLQNLRLRISRLWNVCSCWHTLVQRAKFTRGNWRECESIIVQKNIQFKRIHSANTQTMCVTSYTYVTTSHQQELTFSFCFKYRERIYSDICISHDITSLAGNFRERKLSQIGEKYDFCREWFRGLLAFAVPKDTTPPNFMEKTFTNSHKTTKFAKVFSLKSFH